MLMDFEKLKEAIKSGEVLEIQLHGVEFKEEWRKEHGEKISGIANNEDISLGWVVIGVNDKGEICGYNSAWAQKKEHNISSHIKQYLQPIWAVKDVFSEEINNSHCLFIKISNSQDVVKWNEKAYKRVGTTNRKMTESEILELSLKLPGTDFSKIKYNDGYDSSLVTSFAQKISSSNEDFNIEPGKTTPEFILRKLNIFNTNTTGILFGKFPCRIVNFDKFGDILDQITKEGLYHILSDTFIENIQSRFRREATHIPGSSVVVEEETPYPVKALREVLANAVAHALYQKDQGDIVVETHPNRITVRNNCSKEAKLFVDKWFSRSHKPMNKHLMHTLRFARITDEQGTGKMRVFRLMLESGKREPIIDFKELGDYCRWSITLFNDEKNKKLRSIGSGLQREFQDEDQWRMAMALLLWRDKPWSEIKNYMDEYNIHVATNILKNPHAPVWLIKHEDKLYTKRWAYVRLKGQLSKQFLESEKKVFLNLLKYYSYHYRDGYIYSHEARTIIGLSDHQSEKSQLSALFKEWKEKGIIVKIKKGQWKFIK